MAQRDGSSEDHNIYLLGIVFGIQSKLVRASVDRCAEKIHFRSLSELSRYLSTRVNGVQLSVFKSLSNALSGVDVISGERIREMRCFTDAAGNSYALQSTIEAVVDAITSMLKLLGRTGGLGTLERNRSEEGLLEDVLNNLMDLAQHSLSIQRVWNSVIWWRAGVAVAHDMSSYIVDEKNSDLVVRATIDLARRPALMARAIDNFQRANPLTPENNVFAPYVRLREGRLTVQALPAFLMPEKEREMVFQIRRSSGLLQDATLDRFVRETHPEVGLYISEMLIIWAELSVMASQLYSLAMPLDENTDKTVLSIILESRLLRDQVIETIKRCVALSNDRVKQCIEFFCFTPTKAATLWDKPLLPAGDELVLLWWPLQGTHHARLLNSWAKNNDKLKIAFDTKGTANEELLANALRNAVRKNPYHKHMRFIGTGLHPRQKIDDEVDILIVIDDTAFVIETASLPSPAEAYEFCEIEKRLDKKTKQCRAQCAALMRDLGQISEWANDDSFRYSVTKVFGLVATNSYLRDGLYQGDICHCHWDTLINVIHGGVHFEVTRGIEEHILRAPIQVGPHGSVASGVIAALRHSPKTEFFARCIVPVDYWVKAFDDSDIEGFYRAVELEFPEQGMLEQRLRECSFAPTLEEVHDPHFE
ncbi:hypothetical protein [Pseudoduganella albidiflava]|uniref:Uncharacterized protein n=1 Tax=Pseudoduganella albidiflava TaxID=321983 RepID=A0A411X317_9BURK|nr:hypothetical protein [Pseudoduganella albidiflava]QBI03255.1 hypothetical protein EYF70_22310 [Pseudoduganella albidiflava]GGY69203.1 hypothetical protein GCM10007387_59080 [Pseudoduganella albidiflava]